ncbi:MAG: hypothetical protein PHC88_10970 [Terrimicrobiaceae bacterium]|nr:hypothetical protein [Terrimicrobiaceae bacterium]
MKVALLCLSLLAAGLPACTTLENRRDMYCGYGHVCGPYSCGDLTPKKPKIIESSYKDVVK